MSPDSAPPTPPAEPPAAERGWVWHSTLETKAEGKISVLAVVETVLACIGYWWFAFHFDTHWHLLTSIFVAPLLLLRSPESIKLGVDWFLAEQFENRREWPRGRRCAWGALFAITGAVAAYFLYGPLALEWLIGTSGWALFCKSMVICLLGLLILEVAVKILEFAFRAPGLSEEAFFGAYLGFSVITLWLEPLRALVAGAGFNMGALVGVVSGLGFRILFRSVVCRLIATLRYFLEGWRHLPANWRENNFFTDSTLTPELMPGVREREYFYTLNGILIGRRIANGWLTRTIVLPHMAVIMFLPAVVYRLSIKATAWFWWPLAMLLRPVPPEDEESGEKDRLTWPWRNPFQKALIILSIGIALVTLPGHFLNTEELMRSLLPTGGKVEGVPFLVRVAQALGWDGIRPWHWAVAVMAGCSVGMLWIAGRAVQKDENKHWPAYQQAGLRRDLWCMDMLKRIRFLAMLFFWGTGVLALLLETKAIPEKIPLPAWQTEALRVWFAGDSPVPKGDSQPR